ncbi:MAG: hypothetical protein ACREKK_12650 [Candidatus Methylomirabilales bacterium]
MGKQKGEVKGRRGTRGSGRQWSRRRRRSVGLLLAVTVLGGAFILWAGGWSSSPELAPPFTLPAHTGEQVSLADYVGKRDVVLVFYMFST